MNRSPQAKAIYEQFILLRQADSPEFDLVLGRENASSAYELTGIPEGVKQEKNVIADIPVLRLFPKVDKHKYTIMFIHGGAFCLMSALTHSRFAGHIANACNGQVIVPDYSLAPEFPYPVALNECMAVIKILMKENSPKPLALIGDSAGGTLAMATALKLRNEGESLPFGLVLMAPWLDLTLSSPSVKILKDKDVMLNERNLRATSTHYIGTANATSSYVSPLYGCFRGLPPVYVQASEYDLLLDDSKRLQKMYIEQGLELRLEVFDNMMHSFQFFAGRMPEADAAIKKACEFLNNLIASTANEQSGTS